MLQDSLEDEIEKEQIEETQPFSPLSSQGLAEKYLLPASMSCHCTVTNTAKLNVIGSNKSPTQLN